MLDLRHALQFSYAGCEPGDEQVGDWSRSELENMDSRFVAAVEQAFASGRESRAAAAATVRVESSSNRRRAEETVIEKAWIWFKRNKDEIDIPFSAVVARCPSIDPMRVQSGFDRRFGRRPSSTSSA